MTAERRYTPQDYEDARRVLEEQRDEWLAEFSGSGIAWHEGLPSPYTYQASDFSKLVAAVHEYESRALAAEQREAALVEALREIVPTPDAVPQWGKDDWRECARRVRAALAAHEQAKP